MSEEAEMFWNKKAEILLLDKKIVKIEWMSQKEANKYDWGKRPVTFNLDDGTRIIVQSDDEGNDGGVLWVGHEDGEEVLPVLSVED